MQKTALITGGSRGIGFGIAQALAKEGWSLAINGVRPQEAVEAQLALLREYNIKAVYCRGNIALKEDRIAIVEKTIDTFSNLNVLVNNAGISPRERKDILESDEESFQELLTTNLTGPYFLSQLVANKMIHWKNQNSNFQASIVNISSISSTVASVNRGDYCISKAGVSMMTKLFASRLGEYNIPVYEIQPGIIATDMTKGVKEKYDKLIDQGLTIEKRWGYPEDIGIIAAALLRGDLPYSTGQVINADGGLTLNRL